MKKYQILCHNCNSARSFYGGCPHLTMQAPIPVVVSYAGRIETQPQPFMVMAAQPSALRVN
jgi:hypothetical protein